MWIVFLLCWAAPPPADQTPIESAVLSYSALLERVIDLNRLIEPPVPGTTCRQFSSFDRRSRVDPKTGQRIDWDANEDFGHFLRKDPEGFVMAEMDGPGCIVRIWSANPKGELLFFIDEYREPLLRVGFRDLIEGKLDHFVAPLVGFHGRGANSYVPIPHQRRCRVVATESDFYYHVNYVTYPYKWEVPWFSLPLEASEDETLWIVTSLMRDYAKTAHEAKLYKQTRTGALTIGPGEEELLAELTGATAIRSFRVKVTAADPDTLTKLLRKCVLEITWDDQPKPAVQTPLGEFFGTGPGFNPYTSIPLGTDGNWFYCNWVMPFGESARITVRNHAEEPVEIEWEIGSSPLKQDRGESLYFHARWRRDAPATVFDWPVLECKGPGRYVGCALTVWNPTPRWWGEGDEKIYVDGETFPSWFGTGTEDYFGDAWGHRVFQHGLHNCTRHDGPGHGQYTSVNRWHLSDSIPFQKSFRMTLENYAKNVEYAVVAYWYAAGGATDFFESIRSDQLAVRPWQRVDETEVEDVCTVPYIPAPDGVTEDGRPRTAGRWMTKTELRRGTLSKNTALIFRGRASGSTEAPGPRAELSLNISPGGPCWVRFRGTAKGRWYASVNGHPARTTADGPFMYVGPFEARDGPNRLVFQAEADKAKIGSETAPARPDVSELLLDTLTIDRLNKNASVEAEDLAPTNVADGELSITDETFGYGRWQALEFVTPETGSFDVEVPVRERGEYRVWGRVSVEPADASCVCNLGVVSGTRIVADPQVAATRAERRGAGSHLRDVELIRARAFGSTIPLQFVVHKGVPSEGAPARPGRSEDGPARFVLDSLRLERLPGPAAETIEFESMHLLAKAPDFALEPRPGPDYLSQGRYLLGRPAVDGAAATLTFEVAAARTVRGTVFLARSPDSGVIRLVLDGKAIVKAFDGYAPRFGPSGPIDLGALELKAGPHRLSVFGLGWNEESAGYAFGLDCLLLTPIEDE